MEPFPHPYPIFSALLNLNLLTQRTPKFKVPKILPGTLSPTQIKPKEPKTPKIHPHLNHETAVHILLVKAANRWFDFACSNFTHIFQKLPNLATSSNHLKTWRHVLDKWCFGQNCRSLSWCGIWKSNKKNSSMELAVIWGNFSCSDLACSDLACSDLAHSDLACSHLAHFFVKILNFFHSIFTTWELIQHTPKWNNICTFWDTETFLHSYPIISALPNLTFLTSET